MIPYISKELFKYYLEYAKSKGIPKRIAKGTQARLQYYFERADPSQQIEYVFDRVLMEVWNPVKTIKLVKTGALPPQPVFDHIDLTVYEALCNRKPVSTYEAAQKKFGWHSHEKIRAEESIQATEMKPSEGFIDWIEGAFVRYFEELERSEAESIDSRNEKSFYDRYLTSDQMWQCDFVEEPNKRNLHESVDICSAHVPIHACTRYVEKVYDPSAQFDVDLHMRTSFTNRLKAVDWAYHLQAD